MKNSLLLLLGLILLFVSCQNSGEEELVTLTITAAVGGSEVDSRAFGDGAEVNRCILEVYTSAGVLYKRAVTSVNGYTATFQVSLAPNSYTFVAWADCVNSVGDTPTESELGVDRHYTTSDGLKLIQIADVATYASLGDSRDAFFANTQTAVTTSQTISMTLTRPFGQLNVLTDFYDGIVSFEPAAIRVAYSTELFTQFDASDGDVDNAQVVVWAQPQELTEPYTYYNDHVVISTDYILAPHRGENNDKEIVLNFEMEFYDDEGELVTTNSKFDNIPVMRNYRTNVYGGSLPGSDNVDVSISITIDPAFDGEDIEETR